MYRTSLNQTKLTLFALGLWHNLHDLHTVDLLWTANMQKLARRQQLDRSRRAAESLKPKGATITAA